MRLATVIICLVLAESVLAGSFVRAEAQADADYDLANGHFYTQTNGGPAGSAGGFAVTDDDGVPFWEFYQRLGGTDVLGYPVTSRFVYDGFVTQAMQKAVLQWRPDVGQVYFVNTFDVLHDRGLDDWLLVYRQTPKPFDTKPDTGLPWDQVVRRHLAFLDQNQAIKARFLSNPYWMDHYGLPVSHADMGNSFVIRAQRATFQAWKEDVPWAKAGEVTVANGGDLAKEAGLWPLEATVPRLANGQFTAESLKLIQAATQPTATPVPSAPPAPTATPIPPQFPAPAGVYRARSPEYGVHAFLVGYPATAGYDVMNIGSLGFGWVNLLFEWRQIEPERGKYTFELYDQAVKLANQAGIKVIARIDFQPNWTRGDNAYNGPPYDLSHFKHFVNTFVSHYRTGSPFGHVDAIQIWNEPNLSREWGGAPPDPVGYVRLLKAGYEGAKLADPSVVVISAGMTPTGTSNSNTMPDDVYIQKMYEAGAQPYFDALGVHAHGFKAPPEMSPADVAARPEYGGHRIFTFRRTEDLREIMVRNGDANKQVWITEFGWTSDTVHPAYSWHAVSEEKKGRYLVRAFQYARANWSPWIGVMTVWGMPRPDWGPQHEEWWWAIIDPGGKPRPAYNYLQAARRDGTLP